MTIASISLIQAQKTTLEIQLKTGEVYQQKTYSKMNIEQDMSGQKIAMVMIIKGHMSYLVQSLDQSIYHMEVEYDSLNMSMDLPQGKIEFGTDNNSSENVFSKIMLQMINKPFQVRMNNKGKILEIKNIEVLFDDAFKEFPEIPEAQVVQIKKQLMDAYGEKAFKGSIEMISAIFPDSPVVIGDSWVNQTKLESGMAAEMSTTYTFKEDNSDYYLIHGDSKIETIDKDAYIESNGMSMRYDLQGVMDSTIKIDKDTGWIIEALIDQNIQGDAHIKENDQIPNGMTIPMIMKNEILITNE